MNIFALYQKAGTGSLPVPVLEPNGELIHHTGIANETGLVVFNTTEAERETMRDGYAASVDADDANVFIWVELTIK